MSESSPEVHQKFTKSSRLSVIFNSTFTDPTIKNAHIETFY